MFETHAAPTGLARRMPLSTALSVGAHGLLIVLVMVLSAVKAKTDAEKEIKVAFVGPGRGNQPPPPPPPPAAKKRTSPKRPKVETPKRNIEIAKITEVPKLEAPQMVEEPPKVEIEEADDGDDGVEGGVEGGVKGGVVGGVLGGVVGGVVGGTLGGTGGGGTSPPVRPKAKNVPEFVVKRSAIRQPSPRLSEVFKQANRGKLGIGGMYKVCVDLDGKVYEVTPIKGVPGADESIIDGIKDYWLFQPQQVPVCFLYNMQITVQ